MSGIEYYLVVPIQEHNTVFQGHNRGVVTQEFFKLMSAICCAPNETGEIYLSQAELVKHRSVYSEKNVSAIGSQFISNLPEMIGSDLVVIFCSAGNAEEVAALSFSGSSKVLVVSTIELEGVLSVDAEDVDLVHFLDQEIDGFIRGRLAGRNQSTDVLKPVRSAYEVSAPIPGYGSGVTLSSDHVFGSLGYTFDERGFVEPSLPQSYYDAIVESAEALLEITNAGGQYRQEMILYSPSIMGAYYNTSQHLWNQVFRELKGKWQREFIKNGLIRNPHYSGVLVNASSIDPAAGNPYDDPAFGGILRERQLELMATNLFIACMACANCLPVVRLPNAVNLHQAQLKDIELTIQRNDVKSQAQLQQKFNFLSGQFKSEIGEKICALVSNRSQSAKICSDAPIEWAYLDKLPLMISHEVSKIPMTPGNLLGQLSMIGQGLVIPEAALENILVIRSFQNHDKIKLMLQTAIALFKVQDRISVNFVDVSKTDEVISALNQYAGAIVIFDCHGGHDGDSKPGFLKVGREKLDVWSLAGIARIPPIVLLSACSTHAIGGSHASVANGFLRCGALSVIGTFLPVDAIKSSAFIARIIYRIHSFLPVVKSLKYESISWRSFISGFLRMSYVTDVLKLFEELGLIEEEQYVKIHLRASEEINLLDSSWYDNLLESVASHSGRAVEDVLALVKEGSPLLETMLYCQLGRPELITIEMDKGKDNMQAS